MRIPSGDLAPARRRRRGGRRRVLPVLLAVLLVAALAGGALLLRRRTSTPSTLAAPATCPSAAPTAPPAPAATPTPAPPRPARLPRPEQVALRLFNGTDRNGLAVRVGDQLAARGFRISRTGNPPKPLAGASRVTYGRRALPAATLLAAQVQGAQLVALPASAPVDRVDLVLGSEFQRLASPGEVAQVLRAPAAPVPASRLPATTPPSGC